jgi:hypothetical protein
MVEASEAYEVVVPPELQGPCANLSVRDHRRLSTRLHRDAHAAGAHPTEWPEGPAGVHRGRHRAIVGELWLLYQLDDGKRTLSLVGFGRNHLG